MDLALAFPELINTCLLLKFQHKIQQILVNHLPLLKKCQSGLKILKLECLREVWATLGKQAYYWKKMQMDKMMVSQYQKINCFLMSVETDHLLIQLPFMLQLQENLITNQKQKLHYVWEKSLLWSGANFVTYMIYQRRSLYVEEKTVLNLEGILLLMEMKD